MVEFKKEVNDPDCTILPKASFTKPKELPWFLKYFKNKPFSAANKRILITFL